MGRTTQAREHLVEAARDLVHERGYGAVGVAELCTRAGVKKGSFYYFFASKEALVLEALDLHWERVQARWSGFLDADGEPLDRIVALLADLEGQHTQAQERHGHTIGCLLGNTSLERSIHDPAIRERLSAIFTEQESLLTAVLTEAQLGGQLAGAITPQTSAKALIALMQGRILLAKVHNDPSLLSGLGRDGRRLVS